jgi:hypothetical protein
VGASPLGYSKHLLVTWQKHRNFFVSSREVIARDDFTHRGSLVYLPPETRIFVRDVITEVVQLRNRTLPYLISPEAKMDEKREKEKPTNRQRKRERRDART